MIYFESQQLKKDKARRKHSSLTIGILGCMAQNLKDDLIAGHDHIDFIAGPDSYRKLPGLIAAAVLYLVMAASYLMLVRAPRSGGADRLDELATTCEGAGTRRTSFCSSTISAPVSTFFRSAL